MSDPRLPEGFRGDWRGSRCFIADRVLHEPLVQAGLDGEEGWTDRLNAASNGPSRGKTARLRIAGQVVRLKQLRRGGLIGGLWCDRFPGRSRLLRNISLPEEARRRGVATPRAVALLLIQGPPGLHRGWLALEELEGAQDLAIRFNSDDPPTNAELAAAMQAVKSMHDAGIEHRDLNLGNLLIRSSGIETEAFVIDLDGARSHSRPLGFRRRQRSLRRLERSYVKWVEPARQDPAVREAFYSEYAEDDRGLALRLSRGRAVGRLGVRLHRYGR